jgi:hypothetical protein
LFIMFDAKPKPLAILPSGKPEEPKPAPSMGEDAPIIGVVIDNGRKPPDAAPMPAPIISGAATDPTPVANAGVSALNSPPDDAPANPIGAAEANPLAAPVPNAPAPSPANVDGIAALNAPAPAVPNPAPMPVAAAPPSAEDPPIPNAAPIAANDISNLQ